MNSVQLPESSQAQKKVLASRILDLIITTTALALFFPIMLVVALAIWMDSGWPVFFSQIRLGRGGRHFRIYKFRKFHKDCGDDGCALTVKNDVRMTRAGRLLRKTKFDELPQLWNILKGDMAIIGPRPESLEFADCFTGTYLRVLDYKPGIFGPNQVLFVEEDALYPQSSDPEVFYRDVLFPLKARIDLAYFPYRTFFSDIGWILRGVLAAFGWRMSLPPKTPTGREIENWIESTIERTHGGVNTMRERPHSEAVRSIFRGTDS